MTITAQCFVGRIHRREFVVSSTTGRLRNSVMDPTGGPWNSLMFTDSSMHHSLEILCEDGPLLAVNKPAGLLTQGVPGGADTLEARVREFIKVKYHKPGNVYLGIPHRLDRPTSGVIVFARNSKAAARLAEQFAERSVVKEYLAVVDGIVPDEEGHLVDWLLKDADQARVGVVSEGTPRAKRAELKFRVVARANQQTLLHIHPLTGRMHQIRVQLAHQGWPIVGDTQYATGHAGEGSPGELSEVKPGVLLAAAQPVRIGLHAWRLTLKHPIRYDRVILTAAPPPDWPMREFLPMIDSNVV